MPYLHRKRQAGNRSLQKLRHCGSGVLRQIIGIGTGIGQQLLFIEGLGIVQHLLGGVAKQPVSIPLEGSQIIQLRRAGSTLLFLHTLDSGVLACTGSFQFFRCLFLCHPVTYGRKTAVQFHRVKLLLFEAVNRSFPFHHQGQGGGHDAPHIERSPVESGEQPGSGNPYQPIRLCTAESRCIEKVIFAAGAQGGKSRFDCVLLH